MIYEHWDAIGPFFAKAWQKVIDIFRVVLGFFDLGVDKLVAFFDIDLYAVGEKWITDLWDGVKSVWSGFTGWLTSALDEVTGAFKAVGGRLRLRRRRRRSRQPRQRRRLTRTRPCYSPA